MKFAPTFDGAQKLREGGIVSAGSLELGLMFDCWCRKAEAKGVGVARRQVRRQSFGYGSAEWTAVNSCHGHAGTVGNCLNIYSI